MPDVIQYFMAQRIEGSDSPEIYLKSETSPHKDSWLVRNLN